MEIKSTVKNLRISSTKVRLVANSIVKLPAEKALGVLKFINKGSSRTLAKLVKTAVSDAKNNFGIAIDNLIIKEIRVDQAPTMKRIRPRAQGRADRINKRGSHITLILAEKV